MDQDTFDHLVSWDNLLGAWQRASRGKRKTYAVALFEHTLESGLLNLQSALREQVWRPGSYEYFYIHDPKRRLISAAPFVDRILHHALCGVTEARFERSFIHDSYANRIGKGNHAALKRAGTFARQYPFVLSLDLVKYFHAVDHQILLDRLATKIIDQRVMDLIKLIVESGDTLNGGGEADTFGDLVDQMRPKGLPIGNLTSQFWANVYLNPLDHFIKRTLRCSAYVRYVDDMHLFAANKTTLWEWKGAIEHYLARLRLRCHPGAHPRPVAEGFGFLGFNVYPDRVKIKKRKGIQYQRHLKQMLKDHEHQLMADEDILSSVMSWNNHLSYANTIGLRRKMFSVMPATLTCLARERVMSSANRKKQRTRKP